MEELRNSKGQTIQEALEGIVYPPCHNLTIAERDWWEDIARFQAVEIEKLKEERNRDAGEYLGLLEKNTGLNFEIEELKEENEKLKDNFTHGNIHEIAEKNEKLKEGNETLTKGIDLLVYEIEKLKSQIPDKKEKGKKLSKKDKDALRQVYEICLENDDEGSDADVLSEPLTSLLKRLMK